MPAAKEIFYAESEIEKKILNLTLLINIVEKEYILVQILNVFIKK